MPEFDDEDNFPNDFDGLDFDNIPGLQAPVTSRSAPEGATNPSNVPRNTAPPTAASPVPSTGSSDAEGMDSTFFAAVDALEAHALCELSRGSQSSSCAQSGLGRPTAAKEGTSGVHKNHEYSTRSSEPSTSRKGKNKAEPQSSLDMRTVLAGYETELTCPICCDLLVGAQVANPCGHTCCGMCIDEWLKRNRYEPACAVCRSRLSKRKPVLSNFAMDNLVHQHLQVLAKSGRPEWQEKGYKTVEWNKRQKSWKEQVAARATKERSKEGTRARRRRTRYYDVEDYSPWSIDESMDDGDGVLVARLTPRRGVRLAR